MAYNTEDLERMAVEAIEEHDLIFIEEVVSFLPCSKETFYNHKLHESDKIKAAIFNSKINIKANIRKRWRFSENVTAEIMLYKLTASEEELRRLSVTKSEVTGDEGKPLSFNINVLGEKPPITEEPNDED